MLVSVILPTHRRHPMLRDALFCYAQQDWVEKELIVIDDSPESCRDWCEEFVPPKELLYLHLGSPAKNLSVKRNIAIRNASGEIIVHFDSDDWSASDRVRHQVEALVKSGKLVGGYHTAMFWDAIDKRASLYKGSPNYSWGPALCYRREYALIHVWPESVSFAEDNSFISPAQQRGSIATIDGSGKMVVRLHQANGRRNIGGAAWPYIPTESLPAEFLNLIGLSNACTAS